ncbi:MAG TPA: hypothetical protein VFS37_04865 [Conexibacter sp.]|nr:hypothetical protein [Conexibacter sp.]
MSATANEQSSASTPDAQARAPLPPATLAWLALLPSAALAVAAIVVLGPPLGDFLFDRGSDALWPTGWWAATGHAEPTKHARYLLAVLAPLLPVAVVLLGTRAGLRLSPRLARTLSCVAQVAVLAAVAAFLLRQHVLDNVDQPAPPVFGVVTAAVALALTATVAIAMRRDAVAERVAQLVRETPRRRVAALAVALLLIATWLLKVLMTDRLTGDLVGLNIPFTMNDASAVLNGRTPLVDYHAIYAKLLPFSTALVFAALGSTIFVFTAWMAILDGLALIAVYAVFRMVTRSSLLALLLFAPFLATSDLGDARISAGAISPLTFAAMWPMRYGGAYLLAWLTARHLSGRGPRRRWLLFLVGGVIAVDNLEFGLGAMLATLVALLCARPPRSLGAVLRLGGEVAIGTLGAVAAVCLLTLAHARALPDFALLLEWPRVFSTLGWFSIPLPATGLHLVLYMTFAAAIVIAAVRLARGDDDALLTGMLAWGGVFGLLAGGYFVGRPDTYKLDGMLSAWCFALALLTVLVVRELTRSGWRRPALLHLLVLFGFGLAVCSLARVPLPHDQIARLTKALPAPTYEASVRAFVAPRVHAGETVALLVPMGHRIAHDLGLRNVSPYPFMNAVVTRSQMRTLLDTLRHEHVRRIFTAAPHSGLRQEGDTAVEQLRLLGDHGYGQTAAEAGIVELTRQ